MKIFKEAAPREVMTKREKVLKKRLIALLRDDGKGHRHAKYAERLEDFILKIVSLEDDPEMTAAVNFEEVTIYISEGFLVGGIWKDDSKTAYSDTFYQLNVLMRHELAHYLMQHQIRMLDKLISKYGKDEGTRMSMSVAIHKLLNIIEDFEISNKRYTEADKIIVKNMTLNFEVIGGLVTEEIRKDWQKLSVIEMYDMLSKEIESIQSSLRWSWNYGESVAEIGESDKDWLKKNIRKIAYNYADEKRQTNFFGEIEKYIKDKALYHFAVFDRPNRPCIVKFSTLPENYQNIIKDIYNEIIKPENQYTKAMVKELILAVVKSSPFAITLLNHPTLEHTFSTLYTPEEKFIAVDTLKAMLPTLEHYQTWYDKVKRVLGDTSKYSTEDLEAVLAALNK